MWSRLKPFLLLAVLPVGGCGFTPLYGQSGNSTVAAKLDTIEVQNIPERTGQMLRLALETQLHADGAPTEQLYSLTVGYGLGIANGFKRSASSEHGNLLVDSIRNLVLEGCPRSRFPSMASGLCVTVVLLAAAAGAGILAACFSCVWSGMGENYREITSRARGAKLSGSVFPQPRGGAG